MNPKGELLIEFFSEEIPARMQKAAVEDGKRILTTKLNQQNLTYSHIEAYITPRRLALVVYEILLMQEERNEEKRGPRIDAPSQAIQGFLQSMGLKSLDECEQRDNGKGIFIFANQNIPGQETSTLLPQILAEIVAEFPWPKTMRWASNTSTWIRPLSSVLCVLAGKKVEGVISLGHDKLSLTDITFGHRFMHPQPLKINNFADYKAKLSACSVILSQEERLKTIHRQLKELAGQKGFTLREDEGLLEEVTGLVEWPVTLLGTIDSSFMHLPDEVLITSMRVHQKYFALESSEGRLAPNFLVVANIETQDQGKTIIAGNEKVLRARLSDAAFFFEQDKRKSLLEHAQGLETNIFHNQLGTMAQKAGRLSQLSEFIATLLGSDREQARNAALLCKADLMTSMVIEFPELQGIMGYYYALNDGHDQKLALAIRDHYRPRGPQDLLPSSLLGQIIALADKIDTLLGFFAVGIKPTGSKDPFALRRAALGCIRLLEHLPNLNLHQILAYAYDLYTNVFESGHNSKEDTIEALEAFILDRAEVYWRDQGWRYDIIKAVLSRHQETSIAVLYQRLQALNDFMSRDDKVRDDLLRAYRRSCNILAIEEKKDRVYYTPEVNESLLIEESELSLYTALKESLNDINTCLQEGRFTQAMAKISLLKPAIDNFFDKVIVNSEDREIRANRLRLLCFIRTTLEHVADFSKIEG